MRNIRNIAELDEAIEMLEEKAKFQKQELKEYFSDVMEGLKPIHLIRHLIQSAFSGGNKQDLLKAAIGLGSGILGRKLMMGKSGGSIIRRVLGAALEFGLCGIVAKNAEKIKEKGSELIERFFRRKNSNHPELKPHSEQHTVNYFQKN